MPVVQAERIPERTSEIVQPCRGVADVLNGWYLVDG